MTHLEPTNQYHMYMVDSSFAFVAFQQITICASGTIRVAAKHLVDIWEMFKLGMIPVMVIIRVMS